jgi:hypothetical protein
MREEKLLRTYSKVLPTTGDEGPEGEKRYSCTLSLTSALDAGGWSTSRPGRFTPGNDPVPIVQEDGIRTVDEIIFRTVFLVLAALTKTR